VVRALGDSSPARQKVVRSIARRDWDAHQLAQNPAFVAEEQLVKYRSIPWRSEPAPISAWKGGFTGYPIVDAAMRELRETGRTASFGRVVAASFLVKDLLVDWRVGEKHVRHLLVDADPAQNAGFWQWVAGTGNDASPATRVIDPVEHGRRHDPNGAYIRRWVPELAPLDDESIHAPWEAEVTALAAAGVEIGRDYPHPIVEHARARDTFLEAIRGAGGSRRPAGARDGEPVPGPGAPTPIVPVDAPGEPTDRDAELDRADPPAAAS
jgi:deoxyribodipyrimidine photo-lyase